MKKKGFVNFYLNTDERADADAIMSEPNAFERTVENLGTDGYKVSFSFKSRYSAWSASITTEAETTDNCEWILSEMHDTPAVALGRLSHFHYVVCGADSWLSHMTSIKEFDQ